MPSFFDNLPTELIEMIFRYLSGCDLYLSFGNLNDRFNRLLGNYHYFSLDFRSVSKFTFDSVIKYIRPSDIYALTLSHDMETTGQIELFLSYWKLSDFVNLRSLNLPGINQFILSDIIQLSNLLVLRIYTNSIDAYLLEQLSQIPHLKYLYVPGFCDWLRDISRPSFNRLTHISTRCDVEAISYVCNLSPSLLSVNLVIDG
jgi:hypothetical protein